MAESSESPQSKTPVPLCVVCGDRANGMHYRALTCEGCKTFFRRNARRMNDLKCEMGSNGKCIMDLYMRRHCGGCRMQKCLEVGMQVERLWDKERIKTRKPIIKKLPVSPESQNEDVKPCGEPFVSSPSMGDSTSSTEGPSNLFPDTSPQDQAMLSMHMELITKIHEAYRTAEQHVKTQKQPDKFPNEVIAVIQANKEKQDDTTVMSEMPQLKEEAGTSKELPTKPEARGSAEKKKTSRKLQKKNSSGHEGMPLTLPDGLGTDNVQREPIATGPQTANLSERRHSQGPVRSGASQAQVTGRLQDECRHSEVVSDKGHASGYGSKGTLDGMEYRRTSDQVHVSSAEQEEKSIFLLTPIQACQSCTFPLDPAQSSLPNQSSCSCVKPQGFPPMTSQNSDQMDDRADLKSFKVLDYSRGSSTSQRRAEEQTSPEFDHPVDFSATSDFAWRPSTFPECSNPTPTSPVDRPGTRFEESDSEAQRSKTDEGDEKREGAEADERSTEEMLGLDSIIFKHIMEVMVMVLKTMTAFAKGLPRFRSLSLEDQAALVKGAYLEFAILTSASLYNPDSKLFISHIVPGQEYSKDIGIMGGLGKLTESIMLFAEKMQKLSLLEEETAMLFAICIMTPDRPDVNEVASEQIASEQQVLVEALQSCVRHNHPGQNLFAKSLMLLTDVRDVTEKYMDDIMNLKLQGKSMLPLLSEMFNFDL